MSFGRLYEGHSGRSAGLERTQLRLQCDANGVQSVDATLSNGTAKRITRSQAERSVILRTALTPMGDEASADVAAPQGFMQTWLQLLGCELSRDAMKSLPIKQVAEFAMASDFFEDTAGVDVTTSALAHEVSWRVAQERSHARHEAAAATIGFTEMIEVLRSLPEALATRVVEQCLDRSSKYMEAMLHVLPPDLHGLAIVAFYPCVVSERSLAMFVGTGGKPLQAAHTILQWAAAQCPQLTRLEFTGHFGERSLQLALPSMLALTNLQELGFCMSIIDHPVAIALASCLRHMPSLRTLSLKDNSLLQRKAADVLIQSVALLPCLQSLQLPGTLKGSLAVAMAPHLGTMSALTELNLEGCGLLDDSVEVLAPHLPNMQRLQRLRLSRNCITPAGLVALGPHLAAVTTLEELFLNKNCVGEQGMVAVGPHLASLPLRSLWLEAAQLRDRGLSALSAHLPTLTTLERLALACNLIGDSGVAAVAPQLAHLGCMTYLSFQGNRITNAGAEALAPHLASMAALAVLRLDQNCIGARGAELLGQCIAGMHALTDVHLDRNSLTQCPPSLQGRVGKLFRLWL